jgi:hypothetical protein
MLAFFWYTKHTLTNFVEFLCASNNVQVIRCDFKPGTTERSIHDWSL